MYGYPYFSNIQSSPESNFFEASFFDYFVFRTDFLNHCSPNTRLILKQTATFIPKHPNMFLKRV